MSASIPFWKVQSVGNDFVLFHLDDLVPVAEQASRAGRQGVAVAERKEHALDETLQKLALQACCHRFGIGSDGLLTIVRAKNGLAMRMFNPDGTEDFCGNGLRCAAWHARVLGWVGSRFEISHLGRNVQTEILAGHMVRTWIGPATYVAEKIPADLAVDSVAWSGIGSDGKKINLRGSALSTGSAHLVLSVDEIPGDDLFFRASRELEHDLRFPERISVIWSKRLDDDRLAIRIWERGVGETWGCGTGSSAAAVEEFRRRGHGGALHVENRGGVVGVSAESWDSPLLVEGPAYELFSGSFDF